MVRSVATRDTRYHDHVDSSRDRGRSSTAILSHRRNPMDREIYDEDHEAFREVVMEFV
jgi:hypothetical protein